MISEKLLDDYQREMRNAQRLIKLIDILQKKDNNPIYEIAIRKKDGTIFTNFDMVNLLNLDYQITKKVADELLTYVVERLKSLEEQIKTELNNG